MKSIKNLISQKQIKPDKRNTYEFQAYGNMLAETLGDIKHRALYIKLAKSQKRGTLEAAKAFAMGYENQANKGKLFMWKLKELNKPKEERAYRNDQKTNKPKKVVKE